MKVKSLSHWSIPSRHALLHLQTASDLLILDLCLPPPHCLKCHPSSLSQLPSLSILWCKPTFTDHPSPQWSLYLSILKHREVFTYLAMLGLRCCTAFLWSCGGGTALWLWCLGFSSGRAWALGSWASVVAFQGLVAPWPVESSWTRDQTLVPHIGEQILNHWTTKEVCCVFLISSISKCNQPILYSIFLFLMPVVLTVALSILSPHLDLNPWRFRIIYIFVFPF